MATIKVQQFDNGIKLYFTIRKDGIIEPIHGSVIHFKMQLPDKSRVLNRYCTITDAELGECLYTLTDEDTRVVGVYKTEVQVDYENGTILSMDNPVTIDIYEETIGRETIDNRAKESNRKMQELQNAYEKRIKVISKNHEKEVRELEDYVLDLLEQIENGGNSL